MPSLTRSARSRLLCLEIRAERADALERVREAAAQGGTMAQIAARLHLAEVTLYRLARAVPAVREAVGLGERSPGRVAAAGSRTTRAARAERSRLARARQARARKNRARNKRSANNRPGDG